MTSPVRGDGRFSLRVTARGLVICILAMSTDPARAGGPALDVPGVGGLHGRRGSGNPPGYPGFGLAYHLGYGYGGRGLGIGPEGGYPYYSGPGYPHADPPLQRFRKIAPTTYLGVPGPSCNGTYSGFQPVGPLVIDPPVVNSDPEIRDLPFVSDYGPYTGRLPYPGSLFAPYASPGPGPATPRPDAGRSGLVDPPAGDGLGSVEEPAVGADGVRGLRVTSAPTGTAAERAGLRVGDVIHSINGYQTTERGNVAWIIANAAPGRLLKVEVLAAADGGRRTIEVRLR